MLDGYSLRKYNWKDWVLMGLSSSLFLQVAAVIGFSYFIGLYTTTYSPDTLVTISVNGTVWGTILSLPLTLLVVYFRKIPIFNRKQLSKEESFIIRGMAKEDWVFLIKYIPFSYVLYIIGSSVMAYLFGASEATNQVAVESLFGLIPVWVMFLMIVVVAPIVEELLFRGMFLFQGDRLDTTWVRVTISAVLFGLIHNPSDIYTAYTYIGMGLMFSYAAKRTQSVESAIIYHFLNNLVGFLVIVAVG